MYSVQEERIKESTSLDCTNFTDPCGARYTSSDAYMCKYFIRVHETNPRELRNIFYLLKIKSQWIIFGHEA